MNGGSKSTLNGGSIQVNREVPARSSAAGAGAPMESISGVGGYSAAELPALAAATSAALASDLARTEAELRTVAAEQ